MLLAMAQAPRMPLPSTCGAVVNPIRALLPCCPRLEPVKLIVELFWRIRLAKVMSSEEKADCPKFTEATTELAPSATVRAPKASKAFVPDRLATSKVPPRSVIGAESLTRLLFWVWRLSLLRIKSWA